MVVTWLFGYPWDPTRGIYNQLQFEGLAKELDLTVLVAVPWTVALRNARAFMSALRAPDQYDYPVRYFVSFHLPGAGRSLSGVLYLFSLILQRLGTILRIRPTCLLGSWSYPDGVATSLLGKLLGVPVVLKVHGSDVNVYTQTRSRRWQIKRACNWAYRTACVSKALSDRLIAIGVEPKRVTVNYNGVDQTKFAAGDRDAIRLALKIPARAPLVLFVGNVLETKGANDLLEAFAVLRQRRPAARLVYVGDGAGRAELERRVQALALTEAVRFTGKQPHAMLGQWYAAADLLCLPSHNEGVPNVILEAMACGCAVVATRVGGIPEVLPDFAGLLVEVHDRAALAGALDEALSKPWPADKIRAHASGFTWERNIATMAAILRQANNVGNDMDSQ